MTPQEKLRKIKQELRLANQATIVTKALNEKRDKIDHQLDALIAELEADILRMHQQEKREESSFMNEFNRKKTVLNEMKKHKQELDDKLDEYDSFSSDISIKLHEELVLALLECFPSQQPTYHKLEESLHENKKAHEELQHLADSMERIVQHLDKIVQERASVKRRGIFSYLFGRNPNVTITTSFKEAEKEAQAALSQLDELSGESSKEEKLFKDIDSALNALILTSKKRWGFKSIDATIHPLSQTIKEQHNSLQELEEHYQFRLEADAQALQRWVEKMSDLEEE